MRGNARSALGDRQSASGPSDAGHRPAADGGNFVRQLHAMLPQNLLEAAPILRQHVGEKQALMGRQPDAAADRRGRFRAAPFSAAGRRVLAIVDSAVLDVQPVEPAAVALLVPAEVIVETVDVVGMRLGQLRGRSIPRPWP